MSTDTYAAADPLAAVLSELLANALHDGVVEIKWEDTPQFIAKLSKAGVIVHGGHSDFGRQKALVLSNIMIPIK